MFEYAKIEWQSVSILGIMSMTMPNDACDRKWLSYHGLQRSDNKQIVPRLFGIHLVSDFADYYVLYGSSQCLRPMIVS